MVALSYGLSRCCNYEMAVWRGCMEDRWQTFGKLLEEVGKLSEKIIEFSFGEDNFGRRS